MTQHQVEVLNEKVALISLSIATFAGYRRVTREQIAEMGGSLPNSAAITEGSIKVFPTDGTKGLTTVRRAIFRKVAAFGIKALGSRCVFAVPRDALPQIETDIEQANQEFSTEKSKLDNDYENLFEAHVQSNLVAEPLIRARKVSKSEAMAKCRFGYHIFSITPIVREGQSEEDGVESVVRGLGRQLFEEVAAEMADVADNKAFAVQRVGQKTLRPIRAQVAKMRGLTFLDEAVEGAITLIETILASLPKAGYIEGQPFIALAKLLEIVSDPDELLGAACKVKNGIAPCDVVFPPNVQPAPQPEAAAPQVDQHEVQAEVVGAPSPAAEAPVTPAPRPAPVAAPVPVPPFRPAVPVPARAQARPIAPPAVGLRSTNKLRPNAMMF